MLPSLMRALRLDAEPPVLAVERILRRAASKTKSSLLSQQLKAAGAHFGPRAEVRGGRRISFGPEFSCGSDLWLEAVTSYGDDAFAPSVVIGSGVSLSNRVHITATHSLEIGDGCLFGSGVFISDHNHGSYAAAGGSSPTTLPAERPLSPGGPVRIGKNVWLGDNVVVLGPVVIGDGAVIAANSVVTRDVAPGTIVGGAPARPLKEWTGSGWERV
ncbi:acyltransferase [Curtobacterium sp. MCLR17_007]|uniref:acyltransferase n=1 Tax=Curtobacterium sp. MCLR17_007 TaxID=2175648 RepID=UPI000DAAAB7D|nr:acyltransferase [Curtobacterium sp. MCLR17_007]WIB60767.1 acyltransferase [Curtobacterium sp. MCLR17_007]